MGSPSGTSGARGVRGRLQVRVAVLLALGTLFGVLGTLSVALPGRDISVAGLLVGGILFAGAVASELCAFGLLARLRRLKHVRATSATD